MIEKLCDAPLIHRIIIPLPENPLKNLNSYVVSSGDEHLIIDTGFNRPECLSAMEEGLNELHIDLSKCSLFLSHLHSDHTGLTNYFADRGVHIYMGSADYEYAAGYKADHIWEVVAEYFASLGFPPEEIAKQKDGNHAIIYAPPRMFDAKPLEDGDKIRIGDLTFTSIFVPGHTPGQMCLYMENEKILFSADHILFDITPNISIWPHAESSLKDYLASLDKIGKLDIETTFPAHREVIGNVYDRIKSLKEHHDERLREIYEDIENHAGCCAYEIASRITWSARGRAWEAFSPNQKWFAMGETLAHTTWLLQEGYIRQDENNNFYPVKEY